MKTLKLMIILLLCFTFVGACVGCKPTDNDIIIDVDMESLEPVADMSAYDLFHQVAQTYRTDTAYRRTEFFKFWTDPTLATQESYFEVYRNGDKMLSRNTKIGTGAGKANDLETLYFDGTDFYYNLYKNNKDMIPGGKSSQSGTIDYFKVNDFGKLDKQTDIKKMEDKKLRDTSHIFTYDISDRSVLSSKHDDKVYKDKNDIYYFVLTINCSKEQMDTVQQEARDEFYSNTGAKEGSLEMLIDTTVAFTMQKFNGKLKITSWLRHEKYKGIQAGVLPITCEQTCHSKFSFDEKDCVIDQSVIKSILA